MDARFKALADVMRLRGVVELAGGMMRLLVCIGMLLCLGNMPGFSAQAIIVDGDTLILNGAPYKLEGIDAPETDQVCLDATGATWACGIDARDQLQQFIAGRDVRCDETGLDSVYRNRRMAICWVEGETRSLNQWLVLEGWALDYEPSAKGRFRADEQAAREKLQGVWKGCFVSPQSLRRLTRSTAKLLGAGCPKSDTWSARSILFPDRPAMPNGCTVKGNLTARAHLTGHRGIYHLDGCGSYRRTKHPDRWFCSEQEAQAEGFRRSFTCRSPKT